MKKTRLFLECSKLIHKIIDSYLFLIKVRKNPKYFSKKGKIGFKNIILFILNFGKKSLQIELDNFFKNICKTTDKVKSKRFLKPDKRCLLRYL